VARGHALRRLRRSGSGVTWHAGQLPRFICGEAEACRPGVAVVDWQNLSSLLSGAVNPAAAGPGWFGPRVQIAGYMLPVGPAKGQQRVAHFLLVPDPGDWLNPPHLHASEVIDIRLQNGETAPLVERTAIVVCGQLSFGSMSRIRA
jgi:hypothetical protein